MFGLYRTILALMVVLLHIGGIPWLGGYAVFGFYILSGYLMTLIMHSHYAYNMGGVLRYALNRALRIYPMYWMACFMTLALIFWLGESSTAAYHQAMVYPVATTDVIKNLFLLFPTLDTVRLTPPAWALTVELFFYALIGLGLSRYKALSCWWLVVSVGYHLIAWIWGMDRYFSLFAASLPFAMGAVLFHYRLCWWQWLQPRIAGQGVYLPGLLLLLLFLNWYISYLLTQSIGIFFYTNMLLCALMVLVLSEIKPYPQMTKTMDQWLGDLSYPIYLTHYQVGLVVLVIGQSLGWQWSRPDIGLLLLSIPLIIVVAWLLALVVEQPVERLRRRVRKMGIS